MIARARPLLGTLVSIRADGGERHLDAAFRAVGRVHRLMNFHSAEGDVARVNRSAGRRPTRGCRGPDAGTREPLRLRDCQ